MFDRFYGQTSLISLPSSSMSNNIGYSFYSISFEHDRQRRVRGRSFIIYGAYNWGTRRDDELSDSIWEFQGRRRILYSMEV